MTPYSGQEATTASSQERITISTFIPQSQLTTDEQIRRFELLRLAFFTLKLRKLEQRIEHMEQGSRSSHAEAIKDARIPEEQSDYAWKCSLLRHAIFQQIVTLTKLNAREQAMQLIEACRK